MPFIKIVYNTNRFDQLQDIFFRASHIEEELFDLGETIGNLMAQDAAQRISSISSRTAAGMKQETEERNKVVTTEVSSSWIGYPTSESDTVGSAAEAASRRWATLAHRFEYGYYRGAPRLENPYNPAAGWTDPTPFLEPAFERFSEIYWREVRDFVIERLLSGRR